MGFEGVQKVTNLPHQSFKIDCFLASCTPNQSIERLSFCCPIEHTYSVCALTLQSIDFSKAKRLSIGVCSVLPSLWHSFIHFSINLSISITELIDWSKSHVAKQLIFHAILSMASYVITCAHSQLLRCDLYRSKECMHKPRQKDNFAIVDLIEMDEKRNNICSYFNHLFLFLTLTLRFASSPLFESHALFTFRRA